MPDSFTWSSRFVVCESTFKWAIALRRQMRGTAIRLYETRSLELADAELAEHPASILAVEVTPKNLETLLDWLRCTAKGYPRARVVVLGCRGLEPSEWLLREAGAVHVAFSTRCLEPILRIAGRHLAKTSGSDSGQNDMSMPDAIWERLPWEPR